MREFAAAGTTVVFCARDEALGAKVAAEINANRAGRATFIKCDISNTGEVRSLIESTIEIHGRLDCLINNAGWHPRSASIDDFSAEEFRALLELNLISVFAGCKYALPYLRQTQGNIINISSLVGAMGQLHGCTYVATKGAVTAFTKALAIDEAEHSVRVNSVSPGNIYTPLWQEAIDDAADPDLFLLALREVEPAEATFTTGVDHIISGGAEIGYGRKSRRG